MIMDITPRRVTNMRPTDQAGVRCLGRETHYPVWGCSWYSSVSPGKFWDITSFMSQPLPNAFQLITTQYTIDAIQSKVRTTS